MFEGMLYMSDSYNLLMMKKDTPVLFISGDDDPVGEYGEGVLRAYGAFKNAGMTAAKIILYPGAKHELICETNKLEIMNDVLNWIESNI
jgi:alpha-beta hydrolase superfamily lysophospholipase